MRNPAANSVITDASAEVATFSRWVDTRGCTSRAGDAEHSCEQSAKFDSHFHLPFRNLACETAPVAR
jgi:hypothetical protein